MAGESISLTASERARAQRAASNANLFLMVVQQITVGGIMILFANDVLGFSATVIAILLAAQPVAEILRIPLLGVVERLGTRRSFAISSWVRFAALVVLIVMPFEWLSLPLFGLLLLITMAAWTIFTVTAWGVSMLTISTPQDRGDFFGKMRARFQYMQVIGILFIAFYIGDRVTAFEYRMLLVLALVLVVQRYWCERQLPDVRFPAETAHGPKKPLWRLFRESRLFGAPFWICLLVVVTQTPALVMYLRQALHIPSNLVTGYLVLVALGGAVTLVLWGKLSDALGYRPFLLGLQILSLCSAPLLFFVLPFPSDAKGLSGLPADQWWSLATLSVFATLWGAFTAGTGIGQTSLLLAHVEHRDAFRLQGLLTTIVSLAMALVTILLGQLVNHVAGTDMLVGWFHTDLFKNWYVSGIVLVNIGIFLLVLRMPNMRPEFSMTAFFTALFVQPARHLHLRTKVGAEDEQARLATARWFGRRPHPLALDPLIEFLDDPSYDVRVEAIRSVAVTESKAAARKLLTMLEDGEYIHFWDHIAWALGELRHEEAIPVLARRLADAQLANRTRAMCACALATLEARNQASLIARAMEEPGVDSFLRTSGCRALLRLGVHEECRTIYRVLDDAELFVDRYELVTLVCRHLGIGTGWLLDRRPGDRMGEMLERWVANLPAQRRADGRELIRQLHDHSEALSERFLRETREMPPHPWLTPLREMVEAGEARRALRLLQAAWLATRP